MEKNFPTVSVIPKPVKCELTSEEFFLTQETKIYYSSLFHAVASYLHKILSIPTGFPFLLEETSNITSDENAVVLHHDRKLKIHGSECYRLEVTSTRVILTSNDVSGMFYAVQTLRQLLPVEIEHNTLVGSTKWKIPGIQILDYPRFPWRGFMLDEGRHFHGKQVVKRLLDLMALHKLNVFHWHLTEDQGWRIEVKKYPKLTEVGAWRKASQIGVYRSFIRKKRDNEPHSGFYNQDDIREIVAFADSLNIITVPEIDFPGHTLAVLAAYPEYSCTGGPFEVATDWGIFKDVLCPGKEQVFTFIQEVLDEVVPLFPGPYFHIGGDEAAKNRWKTCPDCQKRIKDLHLTDEEALQEYFTKRVVSLLKRRDKIPIGWNEILPSEVNDLDESVIGQHWLRGDNRVLDHLRQGRKMIISRFFHTYLDYPYTMTPLKKTYFFDPIPQDLEEQFHENILGLEAPLWTEWVPSLARIDWQVFPRLCALAEVAWSPREIDYADFRQRLQNFLLRLNKLEVKYAKTSIVDPNTIKRLLNVPMMFFRDPKDNIT